ncbi:MAG: polysaccharide deacetylase family protein [Spirosomataceae bacterium]
MNISHLLFVFLCVHGAVLAQTNRFQNEGFIRKLYADTSYQRLKEKISSEFTHAQPGHWGEFVKGVDEDLVTNQKIIALTFDACGGPHSSGFDLPLINYLKQQNVPATLFVTGKWIDANYTTFLQLSKEPLFEIENHGFNHRPCSVDGESEYGIKGTPTVTDAVDEIEANARKITALTGRRPRFYRSATAYTDEACAKIAGRLGSTVVSFDVLSGDAVPFTPKALLVNNVLQHVRPGAIIIMHFNHPAWFTAEALQDLIPALRKLGYRFAKLEDFPLREK